MSRFYVGQRVRIVCPQSPRHGRQATVAGHRYSNNKQEGWGWYWDVAIDGIGEVDTDGIRFAYETHELEPLTPPHESGSWEVIERLLPNLRERVLESEAVAALETETALLSLRQLGVAVPHPNHATRVVRVASTGE